jgi:hypothetical protein
MKKKLFISLIIGILIAGSIGFYLFNKPHADIASQTPVATLSASELFRAFSEDEAAANLKYAGKVVEISGVIYSAEEGSQGDLNILFMDENEMFGVACTIDQYENMDKLSEGQEITIKGECSGMLSDVVLIRCVIVK